MRFQLLGPLSIADGQNVVVLQPSKPTSLLAALLAHPNTVVATGYLLRALWDDEQPATARAALQTCVLRLRRHLREVRDRQQRHRGRTRRLPHARRLRDPRPRPLPRAGARGAARRGTPRPSCTSSRRPSRCGRARCWPTSPPQMLHRDEVPRLTEERLRALERACDIELATGRCRQVLVELWEARPHSPRTRTFLRAADRSAVPDRPPGGGASPSTGGSRRRLKEELGVDPGPSLQRLELSILRGDDLGPAVSDHMPALLPPPAQDQAPVPPSVVPASTAILDAAPAPVRPVPTAAVSCFTGREADSEAIAERLTCEQAGTPALVVISGAPGIGKSALAVQTAHRIKDAFPGGCQVLADGAPGRQPGHRPTRSLDILAAARGQTGPVAAGPRRRAPAPTRYAPCCRPPKAAPSSSPADAAWPDWSPRTADSSTAWAPSSPRSHGSS